jgi:hypothetical protein
MAQSEQHQNSEVVLRENIYDKICSHNCIVCSIVGLQGITLFGGLAWLVISIIFLVQTPRRVVTDKCSASLLWECLCATVVIAGCSLFISRKISEDDDNTCREVIQKIASFGVIIWAGIELFAPCAYEHFAWSLGIWEALFAIFIVNCFVLIISSIFALCCICISYARKTEQQQDALDLV